ncbi:DUF551 domain-containing protein [Escherichia coli]|nr:DUF551 domain-containing protein [Escherichia coli]
MSKIDSQALREAAEQAMHDDWGFDADLFHELVTPSIVLALLDERESQNKRIAELEKSGEQLINERDHAESALADMYFAATGDRPEWSNWFGFSDAVDSVVDRIADLEAKQPSPVVPEEKPMPNPLKMYAVDAVAAIAEVRGWNACRAAMLQSQGNCIKDGWISCSDRMPEDTKMLLAFSQGEIVAAYWNWVVNPIDYKKYRAFTYLSGNILDDVTHWMPLPEPPL